MAPTRLKLDLPDMGYVIDPAWSPNGQLLAFSWRRPYGNYDIYVMDAATHAASSNSRATRAAMSAPVGLPTAATSSSNPRATARARSGSCSPTAPSPPAHHRRPQRISQLVHPLTMQTAAISTSPDAAPFAYTASGLDSPSACNHLACSQPNSVGGHPEPSHFAGEGSKPVSAPHFPFTTTPSPAIPSPIADVLLSHSLQNDFPSIIYRVTTYFLIYTRLLHLSCFGGSSDLILLSQGEIE